MDIYGDQHNLSSLVTIDERVPSLLKGLQNRSERVATVNQNSNHPAEVLRKRRIGKTELVVLSCFVFRNFLHNIYFV